MDNLNEIAAKTLSYSLEPTDSQWFHDLLPLPVPDLLQTLQRYIGSLQAVLRPVDLSSLSMGGQRNMPLGLIGISCEEELRRKAQQFAKTQEIVKEFLLNEGHQLQRDLKEYARKTQNWATNFWLNDMYLSNSLPLPINSNPFFMLPKQHFANSSDMLMFATRIIQFSVDFKYRIDQQTLKQDMNNLGKPMCMETYNYFFHSYRKPHATCDKLLPQSRRSNHIVVSSCNQFYVLKLGDDPLEDPYKKNQQLTDDATMLCIYKQLEYIYTNSRHNLASSTSDGTSIPKIGLLTTGNRRVWAKVHKMLTTNDSLSSSSSSSSSPLSTGSDGDSNNKTPVNSGNHLDKQCKINMASLAAIEDSLFLICLDSLLEEPNEGYMCSKQYHDYIRDAVVILSGGGSHMFTANRWFDKFLQIVVGRDGTCGISIEHSASEGITVLRFLREFLLFLAENPFTFRLLEVTNEFNYSKQTTSICKSLKPPKLEWRLNEQIHKYINEAEVNVNKLIDNYSLYILTFDDFGREFIKRQRMSPDSFVQLALQYTFYKCHGCLVSTYESCSLRLFKFGRVDNIRANTCEAFEWIQQMLKCRQQQQEQKTNSWLGAKDAFIKALNKQVEIMQYTSAGCGPDNHLLALRELARDRYDQMPELFTDSSYKEFLNFRLSTSQLPSEEGIIIGYGAVVPNGYGCSYNPQREKIVFCIASFVECSETSSSNFAKVMVECLREMRDLSLQITHQTATN